MQKELPKTFIDEIYSNRHRRNCYSNKKLIKSTDDCWSSDLLEMNDYKPSNKVGIDIFW